VTGEVDTPAWPHVVPDYRPRFPAHRYRVGILGCGRIAQTAHLPAYERYGLEVTSVWSRASATTSSVLERFPFVGAVAGSARDLLDDPTVDVVDIATPPQGRLDWVAAAVDAGKHVLAQKPLTTDLDLDRLPEVLRAASARGVRVAVNQNARWAPAWRLATLLLNEGAIGDVVGVTHLHDKPLPPIAGTPFDDVDHMLITDYLLHWIDISRCWLAGKSVSWVQAHDARVPHQPASAKNPQSATVQIGCTDGTTALLRVVGDVRSRRPGCPFWIHGTDGTIRGSILGGSVFAGAPSRGPDVLELERGQTCTRFALDGEWFVDGFAGAMGELLCAVDENREPSNSASDNVATLRITLAARDSARQGGARVDLHEVAL
jgi:predicted dehydrogenase